ncbi:MAG: SUMF1/EgtB/PvdO family nonheme iron enzyme, partial [Gemmatimonadota bacterium]
IRGIARALGGRGESSLAAADFRAAAAGNPALAELNLAVLGGDAAAARRPGQEKSAAAAERPVGPGTEIYSRITSAPEHSLRVPRGAGAALLVLATRVDGWQGLVVDTGESATSLLSSPDAGGGRTARGLRRGSTRGDLVAAYGEPARVLASRQHTTLVYEGAGILFRTDLDDRVSGWTLFHHEAEFHEPAAAASPGPAERRVALVLGNDAYSEAPLKNAARDARAMAEALSRCRFQVMLEINADRPRMRDLIRQFGAALANADVGLFYYAGHGVQVDGLNYLVPVKARAAGPEEVPDECVAVESLLRYMEKAANDVSLIILDACRNNPYAGRSRSQGGGLAGFSGPAGSFVAFATREGEVAEDGEGPNSRFTGSVLRYLDTPGLEVRSLFTEVTREVSQATGGRQVPYQLSSLTGSFYFVPPPDPAAAPGYGYAASRPPPEPGAATPRSAVPGDEVLVEDLGIYLDRYEVTAAQFAAFLRASGNRVEDGSPWVNLDSRESLIVDGPDGFAPRPGYERHPVVEVTWHGARQYCQWRGQRLPTAEEWRRAALGADGRPYPWGDEAPGAAGAYRANYHQGALAEDGYATTAPVGSFPLGASRSGLYDVAGNVWEWVDDRDGDRRLLMGGSWYSDASQLDGEYWTDASLPLRDAGFRCARDR